MSRRWGRRDMTSQSFLSSTIPLTPWHVTGWNVYMYYFWQIYCVITASHFTLCQTHKPSNVVSTRSVLCSHRIYRMHTTELGIATDDQFQRGVAPLVGLDRCEMVLHSGLSLAHKGFTHARNELCDNSDSCLFLLGPFSWKASLHCTFWFIQYVFKVLIFHKWKCQNSWNPNRPVSRSTHKKDDKMKHV